MFLNFVIPPRLLTVRQVVVSDAGRELKDESSEDGYVESTDEDDSYVDAEPGINAEEAAVDEVTVNFYSRRDSLICCNYHPPVVAFDGRDWPAIKSPSGKFFAIGVDSFDKMADYYTKNNTPADVFGALTFMMSASLEHHSVADNNSSLIDALLVKIKRSSFPKDNRTPDFIHSNSFSKPHKMFCRFVIEYIAMSLYFDYWGGHSASSGPSPYNVVSFFFRSASP